MNRWAAIGGVVLVLAAVNIMVLSKEWVLARGKVVKMKVTVVNRRSLLQGDFMRLEYNLPMDLNLRRSGRNGEVIAVLDENNVARVDRLREGDHPKANEIVIDYKIRDGRIRFGADSFFLNKRNQQGRGRVRYVEMRVSHSGKCILTGLLDEKFSRLGP